MGSAATFDHRTYRSTPAPECTDSPPAADELFPRSGALDNMDTPLSRTNVHVYTDADGNRAVGLSPPLRLDRSADRFRGPLRNGTG